MKLTIIVIISTLNPTMSLVLFPAAHEQELMSGLAPVPEKKSLVYLLFAHVHNYPPV